MTPLRIERLGHLGDGLAQGFRAPRTLPGELIEGTAEGDLIAAPRILEPSPERVRPPCPHYSACGGCALQHARESFTEGWKQEITRRALAAQGLEAEFLPTHTSPLRSRRRATLSGRRTKSGSLLGFHGRASGTIAEIRDCLILRPALTAAFPALHEIILAGASRKAELALTITETEGGPDIAVTGGKPMDPSMFQTLAALAEAQGLSRLTWEGEAVVTLRPPAQAFGRARVSPPPGAFLQATREGEAALLADTQAAIGRAERVADLFSGSGTFSLPLAERAEVHAVESDPAMLAALDAGWRAAPGLKRVTTEARDLFRRPLLPDELNRFDAVVIDPPRAGAEAQVLALAESAVPVIAAISCNPVTFARDARLLTAAGYRLGPVRVVDQFRFSPHVELTARFTRG